MIGPKKLVIALILFLILLCIISFGTKGAHWDKIHNKSYWIDALPNIYRPMEGCIALDVILIVLYLTVSGLVCKHNEIIARFLLGVIFLAGENERGRMIVDDWLTMSSEKKSQLSEDTKNYYMTFEGAYVFEIIDIIVLNTLSPVMLLTWRHLSKNMANM